MTTTIVDSIITSFPNNKIETSDEDTTYNIIKEVGNLPITNVAPIRSELGGGQHGFLGLLISTPKNLHLLVLTLLYAKI